MRKILFPCNINSKVNVKLIVVQVVCLDVREPITDKLD